MICVITPELYREAFSRLCEAIGRKGYFSGTVAFPLGDLYCRFTVSVIVYRQKEQAPEGVSNPVSDLVPVWWEFHTLTDGTECLNDFSFNEMRTYIH